MNINTYTKRQNAHTKMTKSSSCSATHFLSQALIFISWSGLFLGKRRRAEATHWGQSKSLYDVEPLHIKATWETLILILDSSGRGSSCISVMSDFWNVAFYSCQSKRSHSFFIFATSLESRSRIKGFLGSVTQASTPKKYYCV